MNLSMSDAARKFLVIIFGVGWGGGRFYSPPVPGSNVEQNQVFLMNAVSIGCMHGQIGR